MLRGLDGLLSRPERVRYDVVIAERGPLRLAGVTGPVRAEALEADTSALCLRAGPGDLVALFPLDLTDSMDVTVGVPAPYGTTLLPGGGWASTLHVGPYAQLPLAYAALLEHVRERGHEARGPITETYLNGPRVAAPPELVTRLAVAVGP